MANGMPKDYKYKECRLFRHSWSRYEDTSSDATVDLECTRCTCLRHEWYQTTGKLRKRRYEYPTGYILTREERPTADQLRKDLMTRLRGNKR